MDCSEQLSVDILLRILESLYPDGDQLLSSFLYGTPGAPPWQRRIGDNIFVREHQYIEALLFLRKHGAPFLRDISISSLWSMMTEFVTEHYAYIIGERLILTPGFSLARQVSPRGLNALSQALLRSSLFNPTNEITLYPLVPVIVKERFQSHHFSFTGSDGLAASLESFGTHHPSLLPTQFPPIEGLVGVPEPTSNWLCISAPDPLVARKRACATLGALALTPVRKERYLQTERSIYGGYCTISTDKISCTPGTKPMTPRIASNIILTQADHSWLEVLSTLFDGEELAQKSHIRALEYFHRAWFDEPRERFPTLCMALDSLVAAQHRHTKAAVDFVVSTIDEPIDQDRLHLLMKLRGAVIHGAAPDVYESEYYEAYYSQYGEDPICDLELVVASCLRQSIFEGKFRTHPDPHTEIVKQHQDLGLLPQNMRGRSIIADD